MMKISPEIVAMRIRENQFDALDRCLADLILDRNFELVVPPC